MFFKRLSTALCAMVCFSGFVLGANPETGPNANVVGTTQSLLAPLAVSFVPTPNSPRCNGEDNGSIDIQIGIGYTAPFTYQIQRTGDVLQTPVTGNPQSFTIPNLSAGEYRIIITDATGDSGENTTTIVDNPELNVFLETPVVQPACSGETADLLFDANGGDDSDYTFRLFRNGASDGSNNDGDFLNRGEGNYSLIVTDGSGCEENYNGTINITVPDLIDFNANVVQEINCDNGTAKVELSNLPTDAFTVALQNTTTGSFFSEYTSNGNIRTYTGLTAGDYSVRITRASCSTDFEVENFSVASFEPVVLNALPNSPVVLSCGGINDLTDVQITVNGGKAGRQVHLVFDNNNGVDDDQEATVLYGEVVNFNDVLSGNYTVRWNDVLNPSCAGSIPYIISSPSSAITIDGNITGIPAKCNGEATGTVQIPVSGGQTPYTYYVDGVSFGNDQTAIQMSAGDYTIKVVDANGCETEELPVSITQPDPLIATHNAAADVDVSCPGGNDGEISISVTGGNGGYTYDLTGEIDRPDRNGGAEFVVPNLLAGTYDVLVKDSEGCEATLLSGIVIDEPDAIVISDMEFGTGTNVVCYGETTTLSVNATGGSTPFLTYDLYRGGALVESIPNENGTALFEDLISSTYTLRITSDPNCATKDTTFTLQATPQLRVLNYQDTIMVDCANDMAELNIRVNGFPSFSYQLDDGPVTSFTNIGNTTISGISAALTGQTHDITIFDGYGCEITVPVTVFEPELLNATLVGTEDVSCLGKNDGSFELEISGGTPGYSVAYSTNEVSASGGVVKINNVSAGVYDVQVTDANNCRLEALVEDVTIEEPSDSYRIEPAVIVDPIICPGGIAEVVISTSGGWNGSSEITLTGNDTTIVQAAGSSFFLEEGSYTAYARNEDGCQFTRTISIAAPDPLVITVTDKQDVSCAGANDAQFTINVNQNGGTAPYKYGFSGVGSADVDFTGNSVLVSSGIVGNTTYNVVVADVNGCQSNIVPITINEPDPVVFEYRFDSVSCNGLNDARINIINASGGSGTGYQTWLTPQGQAETQRTFPTITGLAANTYSLRVTDNSGICTSEAVSVKIFEPSQILFIDADFEIEGIRCYGIDEGRIFINADGGLPYNLEYKITTNSGFDSGYSTEQEYTNLAPGDYTAWVRNDRGNCEMAYPTPLTVKNVDELVVNAPDVNDVSCHNLKDGNVQIEATGGTGTLTYTLTDAAATIANNPNTTGFFNGLGDRNKSVTNYEYEVVDINGCAETGNFSVGNPPELVLSILDQTDVVCHNDKNGTMLLRATGGTLAVESDYGFYDLNNSALTYDVAKQSDSDYLIQNIGTTQPVALYHPIVRDDNNCTDTLSVEVEITNPEQVRIADVIWGEKDCWGSTTDSTIVFATGGVGEFRYSLDGGQSLSAFDDSIFIGEAVGNKIVYIEDENGCSALADDTYEYTQPDPLTVNYLLYGYKCSYDPSADMELKITGGTGNYALAINDPNFEGSVYSINPSASGDTTYYVFSENLIQLDPETQYDFYLRDENNCHIENIAGINTYSDEFADTLFNIPEELVLETLTPRGVKCSNDNSGQIQFKASGGTVNENGGYVLTVYHNERTMGYPKRNKAGLSFVENVFSGLHKAYLTDANGCEATTRLSPISNFDTITVPSENESIELITEIVDPTCDLTFDGELIISVDKFRDMGFTAYVDLLDVETGEYYKFDENDTIPADRNFYNIENEGDTLFYLSNQLVADNVGIGTYALRVMDNYSYCETYDTLDVFSVDSLDCPDQNNYILFTPHNGDDLYDEWRIIGSQFQRYNLRVYTAYGELVYSDKGLADGEGVKWEGIDDRGTPVPAGTYIYLLNQHMGTPQDTTIHGNVTILRGSGR